ncbi:hypothetical protein MIN45_P2170 [Methylomarinovum tepidoasis]|uniref:Tetratricopeptide repeat protein n=2 Tax=Methylomarinovum tepidoasis TaxID=2840183 RepID=A0AAU9CQ60_9GAMM|nr:hypothetical protein MIN45_P2170 [Methylomarinovum sp. IN45]
MKGSAPGEHAHHFCHGLKYLIRARRAVGNKQKKRQALKGALNEFGYVETHTKNPHGVLLPYVALYKGDAFLQLGRRPEALREYLKAIRLRPKFPQAYAKLAKLYQEMGQIDKAAKVLRYGIRKTHTKSLVHQLQRLNKDPKTK